MNETVRSKKDYQGSPSTLCKGCGHDSITTAIINTCYDLALDPQSIIKLSGIGCSSKTPNYFLEKSFGFNSIHGRMASLATGVHLSQPEAKLIGISGDGDTASIGLGGFLHLVRRNIPIVYIIADNGVYGLTKGQFSATSIEGDLSKGKQTQTLPELDMLLQGLVSGCGFVARAFSGDQVQLKNILKLALHHKGTSVIDVVSPCVAYGNHVEFSKSYTHTQEINEALHEIDIITDGDPIGKDQLHYTFKSLNESHNPKSYASALKILSTERSENILHTGVLYINDERKVLSDSIRSSKKDKHSFNSEELRLPTSSFQLFNDGNEI